MMSEKLTKCCKQPYAVVIIDLNMPVLDGIEMIKQIKERIEDD